jgi:hypothetical protein
MPTCKAKHLSDEEMAKRIKITEDVFGREIQEVHKSFHESGLCHDEFVTYLVNVLTRSISHGIEYMFHSKGVDKKDGLETFLHAIVAQQGGQIVKIHVAEFKEQAKPLH